MANGNAYKYPDRGFDFLMGLGSLYLAHDLLDPAEELFAQIPSEDAHYVDATVLQIEIQSRKQNHQEVVRLAETLVDKSNISKWLLERIGVSYFYLGQVSKAKSYFLKSMTGIPENSQVRDKLKSVLPLTHRPKIKDLILGDFEIGISPHLVLDCIAPILWGGRPVTCCFSDQLLTPDQPKDSEMGLQNFYLELATNLYQRFGIFTSFLSYVELSQNRCAPLLKLFFSLDPSVFDRVEDIKRSAWNELEKQQDGSNHCFEHLKKEGALLGYPECCVEWASNNRHLNKSIEILALTALIEEEYISSLEPAEIPRPGAAYFAFEFYPCSPRCVEAEKVGYDIFRAYRRTEIFLSDLFRQHVLSVNKGKMYDPMTFYADFIDNFNKTIIWIIAIEEFRKTHEEFDFYREDILAILKEHPYLDGNPNVIPLVYEMAKKRVSQRSAAEAG